MLMLGLALTTLAGCQTYQPKPLDASGHLDAWSSRSLEDASLRSFVDTLDAGVYPGAFDPSDGLDLHEAERVALYYNPRLRLERLRAGVAAADSEHAGLWDDLALAVDAMRITDGGNDPWIVGGSLSITIPISGRLSAERERADASLRASLSRVAEQEWSTRIELRNAWHEWSAMRSRAQRTQALLRSISSLAESTTKLAEAGELPATQAALFQIEQVSQSQLLLRYNTYAQELEQRIRALMGLSPDAPLTLNPSLAAEPIDGIPDHDALIERHPTLTRLRDEYAVSEATLLREIRAQYPDLTIGPAYESEQGESRIGLVAGIPLPILNANKRGIAQARAQRELARAEYETALESLMNDLSLASDIAASTHLQRAVLESELIPLVDRQLQDAQRLLELGESDGLVLLESLSRVGQASMQLIDARLEEARAMTRLEALIGPLAQSLTTQPSHDSSESEVTP